MKHTILNELFMEKVRTIDDLNAMISECNNLLTKNIETKMLLEIRKKAEKYIESWVFDFQTFDQHTFDKTATDEEVTSYVDNHRKKLEEINRWLFDNCKRFLHKYFDDNSLKVYFWYLLDDEIKRVDSHEG